MWLTAPQLIDTILLANADNLPGKERNTSNFGIYIIQDRNIEAHLAAHRATLPFLEGTKPPFETDAECKDSFLNATIEDLAAFALQKLFVREHDVFAPPYQFDKCFLILDEETAREGSVVLVSLTESNSEEDSDAEDDAADDDDDDIVKHCDNEASCDREQEDEEDEYDSEQQMRLAGERVGM